VETQRNTTEELDIRTSLLSDANKSFDALVKEKNQDVQLINSQRVELEVLRTLNSRLEKNASVLLDVISPEDSTRTIAERLDDCLPAVEKFFKLAVKDAVMDARAVIKSHFSSVDLLWHLVVTCQVHPPNSGRNILTRRNHSGITLLINLTLFLKTRSNYLSVF